MWKQYTRTVYRFIHKIDAVDFVCTGLATFFLRWKLKVLEYWDLLLRELILVAPLDHELDIINV